MSHTCRGYNLYCFDIMSFRSQIRYAIQNFFLRRSYQKLYQEIYKNNSFLKKKAILEDEWLHKWKSWDSHITIDSFRIFSRYIGADLNILPLEYCATVIEPFLDPKQFWAYYNDKNMFDKIFGSDVLPKTIIRNIDGVYYTKDYKIYKEEYLSIPIDFKSVIVKPTIDGESGKGVTKLQLTSNEKIKLDSLNRKFGKNFIVQECLQQHPYMSQFNATSVNTIRIMTYRSLLTNEVVIPNAILRVGAEGKSVDNAHAGGMFCGISSDGVLGKYMCDYLGNKKSIFNGVDYSNSFFCIPNYDNVKEFAKEVAGKVLHHRLLALDIMLNNEGIPKLIEVNVGGFSAWLFQYTNGSAFGEYTDEVITFLKKDNVQN